MQSPINKARKGQPKKTPSAYDLYMYVSGELARGLTLEHIAEIGLAIRVRSSSAEGGYATVAEVRGDYLKTLFRRAEKEMFPEWMWPDSPLHEFYPQRVIGISLPKLPTHWRARKRGRPKKIKPTAK